MYNEYPCFSMEDTQWRYSELIFFLWVHWGDLDGRYLGVIE